MNDLSSMALARPLGTTYLITPKRNGDFGIPVHGQVVRIPHEPKTSWEERVM